jgi:hypothetical protein
MRGPTTWILALALAAPSGARAADRPADPAGFLYGTIETDGGQKYTGLLRWGTEESFWDDLFNSVKKDPPYLEKYHRDDRRRRDVRVLGFSFGYAWDDDERQLVARFGDVREIEPLRGEMVRLTMKDGTTVEIDGGSNDIGTEVFVHEDAVGDMGIEWHRIERITFAATPSSVRPPARRLYGVATTHGGTFEGHVQWDKDECRSTDKLNGESVDGDVAIEMGKIKTIERAGKNASHVVLQDGREFELRGTNDVDSSIRGILIEDPRYGRVEISWDAFEKLDLKSVEASGRGYGEFPAGRALRGTVTSDDGAKSTGRIVFDLDEQWSWEMLDGQRDGVEYHIPFGLIRSIEPQRGNASKIVLRAGGELVLEDGQDVSDDNDGVVILGTKDQETHVDWDDVRRIDFD